MAVPGLVVRETLVAPWPGYMLCGLILTPDVKRFEEELELIAVKGAGPVLVRLEGPLREPATRRR
jgi:hypothetical protein